MEGVPAARQERLPTVEVPNEVVWVNDKLKAPLDIKLGEHSKLGVVLALGREEGTGFPGIPRDYHWRSLDIGKVYFEDSEHRIYRDIDMKGTGLLAHDRQEQIRSRHWYHDEIRSDMRGLLDKSEALHDAQIAELFTQLGMRTHRAIAIIELEELNANAGKKHPVETFKERGDVPHEFDPVVEVRAFGIKTRVGDVFPMAHDLMAGAEFLNRLRASDAEHLSSVIGKRADARAELQDALSVLSTEFGRPFTLGEYLPWFISEVGRNVGIMHNAGYIHGFMHSQNVTLDGRLTDFDTAYLLSDMEKQRTDLSAKEIQEDQEAMLYDEINYVPGESYGQTKALLDWLEPFAVMLQKLFPVDMGSFDTTRTNELFFQSYWEQLTNDTIRAIVRMFLEGNTLPVPGETK